MAKAQRGRGAGAAKARPPKIMFVVETRQRDALQDAAMRMRAERGGGGRLDASEVLRAVLDDWIEAGAKLPRRLLEKG